MTNFMRHPFKTGPIHGYMVGILFLFFYSCGVNRQASELKALKKCHFELAGVDSLFLGGMDLGQVLRKGELSLSSAPGIAMSYMRGELPLSATLDLRVSNPTNRLAGIRQFDYIVLLDEEEVLKGTSDTRISVPGGSTAEVPFRIKTDIYPLVSKGKNLDKVLALLGSGDGKGTQMQLSLRIKPTISLGNKTIDYPGYVTINKVLDKAAVNRFKELQIR